MSARRLVAVAADGQLAQLNQAGVLDVADIHLARTLGRLGGETDQEVLLAVGLTARALRMGSVCLPLDALATTQWVDSITGEPIVVDVDWPDPARWRDKIAESVLVQSGDSPSELQTPMRLVDGALYLARPWAEQEVVATGWLRRLQAKPPDVDEQQLQASLDRMFASRPSGEQRRAVETAVRGWTTVIAGGPGTGKTSTLAALLVALAEQPRAADTVLRVGLAAPTGKAAARMTESLATVTAERPDLRLPKAGTIFSLLAARGLTGEFGYGPANPLPHEVVVIDEVSMVPLSQMSALVAALPDQCRLVLLGDPDQLTSIDAGAVLADITAADLPLSQGSSQPQVVRLTTNHRSVGGIRSLAEAVIAADAENVLDLLDQAPAGIEYWDCDPAILDLSGPSPLRDDLVRQGRELHQHALTGEVEAAVQALDAHRLLCAHRSGPYGVAHWSAMSERLLRAAIPGFGSDGPWYPGRPLLLNTNQRELGVANGDTAVIVRTGSGPRAALSGTLPVRLLTPYLLDQVSDLFAMTVHKSQGSQFETVTLVLPPASSPLLTRELFYTAITRAVSKLRIIGPRDSVRRAVQTRARRASGLTARLTGQLMSTSNRALLKR